MRSGEHFTAIPIARRRRRLDANAYFQNAGLFEGNSVKGGTQKSVFDC